MSIIAISGKMQSGKNTTAYIIQYLIDKKIAGYSNKNTEEDFNSYVKNKHYLKCNYQQKAFAGKLKQIVSILTGIPVGDLEKQEVKDKVLGEEWNRDIYQVIDSNGNVLSKTLRVEAAKIDFNYFAEHLNKEVSIKIIKNQPITVRQLLQETGTDAMRDVIHPNIWVNALFADYCSYSTRGSSYECVESNWIITDCRFPNELEAIKKRNGISIRVNRYIKIEPGDVIESLFGVYQTVETIKEAVDSEPDNYRLLINGFIWNYSDIVRVNNIVISTHHSETALDYATFDYTIYNDGTIEELIEKVKQILIQEKII